ncbi:MAG TPA: glycosyltransferase [Candidatus Eisenbacteria bacterium]|nr:glycosyltransferase [Candidatus Eisenbacteria bacterium]
MPAVSVIIPAYNCERFIGEALQSVLEQSFRDFEIVVVDDGSTDGTSDIVNSFTGPITCYRQPNKGAAAARNLGLSLAKGDWVALLDADDAWYPNKLSTQIEYIKLHPETFFVYSDIDVIDGHSEIQQRSFLTAGQRKPTWRPFPLSARTRRPTFVSIVFNGQPFPYPSTVLARRDLLLRAGGFNPAFQSNYHEDFEFFARLIRLSEMRFIPQALVKYRAHPPPRDKSVRHQNWFKLLQSLTDLWSDDQEKKQLLQRQFAKYYARLTRERLLAGDLGAAADYFRQACRYRPQSWRGFWSWLVLFRPNRRDLHAVKQRWLEDR